MYDKLYNTHENKSSTLKNPVINCHNRNQHLFN